MYRILRTEPPGLLHLYLEAVLAHLPVSACSSGDVQARASSPIPSIATKTNTSQLHPFLLYINNTLRFKIEKRITAI